MDKCGKYGITAAVEGSIDNIIIKTHYKVAWRNRRKKFEEPEDGVRKGAGRPKKRRITSEYENDRNAVGSAKRRATTADHARLLKSHCLRSFW